MLIWPCHHWLMLKQNVMAGNVCEAKHISQEAEGVRGRDRGEARHPLPPGQLETAPLAPTPLWRTPPIHTSAGRCSEPPRGCFPVSFEDLHSLKRGHLLLML